MTCTPLHENTEVPTGRHCFPMHLLPSGGGWTVDDLNRCVGLWCALGMYRALGDDTEVAAVAGQIAAYFAKDGAGASGSRVIDVVMAYDPLGGGESFEDFLREAR
jgi:hypothetical protein